MSQSIITTVYNVELVKDLRNDKKRKLSEG